MVVNIRTVTAFGTELRTPQIYSTNFMLAEVKTSLMSPGATGGQQPLNKTFT